jgi:hypothetical protein
MIPFYDIVLSDTQSVYPDTFRGLVQRRLPKDIQEIVQVSSDVMRPSVHQDLPDR